MSYVGDFPAHALCPLWGAKPARFCPCPRVWEDFECSPTSIREAPHACLISPWIANLFLGGFGWVQVSKFSNPSNPTQSTYI